MGTAASDYVVTPVVLPTLDQHDDSVLSEAYGPRFLYASAGLHADCNYYVSVREISDLNEPDGPNVALHTHAHDQMYLLIGAPGALTVEVRIGDDVTVVETPGSIVMPAGTAHSFRALRGSGLVVAILGNGTYTSERAATGGPATIRG